MKHGLAIVYSIWAVIVFFNWFVSTPESAPQQAALAGQTLVLAFIPYAMISIFQRSANTNAKPSQDRPLGVDTYAPAEPPTSS